MLITIGVQMVICLHTLAKWKGKMEKLWYAIRV